ncbi:MAG: MFS transporter [Gammaproteobacteria bacterium]|nr:MFS transporter [Gammaproteobacteria bacterium]MDE0511461.1 MFS transporter [Gammaproteobacteria bacterium]
MSKLFTRPAGVVFACTVGNAVSVTPMVYTVFGLFLIPISSEFGWSRAAVSFVLFIIAIAGAISYPIVGRLIDRYGARPVILTGNVLFAASVASVSLVEASRFQFYFVYALIGISAAIPSSVMFTKVIAGWFDRRRGLFLGIAGGLGNGVGAALSPLFVFALISSYGWRAGFQGIGAAIILIGFPVLYLLLRDPPRDVSRSAAEHLEKTAGLTLAEALKTPTFWIILAAIALGAGCMTAIFAHVVPMLVDRGIPAGQATTVLAMFSLVTAGWQIGMGYMLDRIPRPWIAAPFYLLALTGLVLLESTSSYPLLLLSAVLMGLGLGTEYGILPYFLSRYFGTRHYGAISGSMYGVIVLTQGLTPFLMDLVFDITGTYDPAIIAICIGLAAGAVLITRLLPFHAVLAARGNP